MAGKLGTRKLAVLLRATLSLICLSAIQPAYSGEKKNAYLLAVLSDNNYTVLQRQDTGKAAPVGSLLKPFAAWYLLEKGVPAHQNVFCPPEKKRHELLRCWTPNGHGAVNLAAALVQSCNYYFLSLFAGRDLGDYQAWLTRRFDWPVSLPIEKPVHVYGFDLANGIDPERLASMYLSLLLSADKGDPHATQVRNALGDICFGTLADFCRTMSRQREFRIILGKTGTVQSGKKPYGIALVVLEHIPRKEKILLLCYELEKTGSGAALAAPAILSRYAREIRKSKNLRR